MLLLFVHVFLLAEETFCFGLRVWSGRLFDYNDMVYRAFEKPGDMMAAAGLELFRSLIQPVLYQPLCPGRQLL